MVKKIDMSSEAISRRLRQVVQIRYLCLWLTKAKKKSDEKTKKERPNDRDEQK